MPTYTVHAPPPRQDETMSAPERFVFVRDGFHFWAFLLAPLWLLLHGLWLALVIYIVGSGVVTIGLVFLHASAIVQFLVGLLIALLIGFEASSIWRWTLARRSWTTTPIAAVGSTKFLVWSMRLIRAYEKMASPSSAFVSGCS